MVLTASQPASASATIKAAAILSMDASLRVASSPLWRAWRCSAKSPLRVQSRSYHEPQLDRHRDGGQVRARDPGLARPGDKVDPCRQRTTSEETTMLNRRRILRTGAATVAAAMIARMPRAFAATYDLVIKGGRVIDPSVGLDAVRDVAIAKGKIAAVDASIAGDAAETIDAGGKLVVPGLIDIHTHAGRSKEGTGM